MTDNVPYRLSAVGIGGYRSLRQIQFPVDQLSVFVGANGVGKTNLYRALLLVQAAAAGRLALELAGEGGMASAMSAAKRPPKGQPLISFRTDFETEGGTTYSYEVAAGFASYTAGGVRQRIGAAFLDEPQIKAETLSIDVGRRKIKLLDRQGPSASMRNMDGIREVMDDRLLPSETALGSFEDPSRFPDLYWLRRTLLDWRFYHNFRTDQASPLRQSCLAVTSPTLASDGANLAAVFATLVHIREDTAALDQAIDDAFPGAQLVVPEPDRTASFGLVFPEYPQRVFDVGELSDGTLRYLALAGALLSYRLPSFVALNEPETSLHPSLLEPLARLIIDASKRSQIWLVTHSEQLAEAIASQSDAKPRTVIKRNGETWIEGLKITGMFEDEDAEA
ncbi:MAG TPA: AAA family ATPase [Dongiaceae bacterium]|nr:AAA family ATPase [Dongiaceae bacterium]